jgi:cysteine desulfurase / selenocysteine lyase
MIHTQDIRRDFPLLKRTIQNKPIIYLDSTATTLKPQPVIDALNEYMSMYSANIFRGIYTISEEATAKYEHTRTVFASFLNTSPEQIIFVRNATEALNLVAYSWLVKRINKNDSIVVTAMEHHSNFVPWQQIAFNSDAQFKVMPVVHDQPLDISLIENYVDNTTKIFAFTAVSNVLGTINPVDQIVKAVRSINAQCLIVVDAAQAVPHMPVDVTLWDADFIVCSGHKMLGPTGFGVLWGKKERLEELPPFLYGGEMIREVTKEKTTYKEIPHRFEAGTPAIAEVIAAASAVEYLQQIGMKQVREHEKEITRYALSRMKELSFISMYGPLDPEYRGGVISFTMSSAHPHDIAQMLNEDNICIRSGNHCAMPLHTEINVMATARASFYIYTTKEEIDTFIEGLQKVHTLFSK